MKKFTIIMVALIAIIGLATGSYAASGVTAGTGDLTLAATSNSTDCAATVLDASGSKTISIQAIATGSSAAVTNATTFRIDNSTDALHWVNGVLTISLTGNTNSMVTCISNNVATGSVPYWRCGKIDNANNAGTNTCALQFFGSPGF